MSSKQNKYDVMTNVNGGRYHQGIRYDTATKYRVADVYLQLMHRTGTVPSTAQVARVSQVSWKFANKVLSEIAEHGEIIDVELTKYEHFKNKKKTHAITLIDAALLLSMRAEKPNRLNLEYVRELFEQHDKTVCSATITNFFNNRFPHKGNLCKPNTVPLDKWKPKNLAAFVTFYDSLRKLRNRLVFHFLDEKHIVNKDALGTKVRRDPLTGYIPHIQVSGDFREAYNLFACITANPTKSRPIFYKITKDNGTAEFFMSFIESMITSGFLRHNEVVVMDNAAIHSGKEASGLEDLLWNLEVEGRPLQVLVLPLPARSPELNPIELIFHILLRRIRSFRYNLAGPCDQAVIRMATKVLDDITYDLVYRTIGHCGYFSEE